MNTKSTIKKIHWIFLLISISVNQSKAQSFVQDFDSADTYFNNVANQTWSYFWDWTQINHSSHPFFPWNSGSGSLPVPSRPGVQAAQANWYLATGLNASLNIQDKVNLWLISPMRQLNNGDQIFFYTVNEGGIGYRNRLQVRLSVNDTSTDVGIADTATGDFSILLLDVNPNYDTADYPIGYPRNWHLFQITINSLSGPSNGRFAFRYFNYYRNNCNPTGIDSIAYVSILGVGMDEQRQNSEVFAYPNPSKNIFHFKYDEAIKEIEIKNILGEQVAVSSKKEIDLSGFPEGVYLYQLISQKGKIYFGKLLKE